MPDSEGDTGSPREGGDSPEVVEEEVTADSPAEASPAVSEGTSGETGEAAEPVEAIPAARRVVEADPVDLERNPVVVVGVGCWYPGAHNPAEFWANVLARRRQFRKMLVERLPFDEYGDDSLTDPDTDKTYCKRAAFIDGFEFDYKKWRINKQKFETTDLAHWLSLEVAGAAVDDCGFNQYDEDIKNTTICIVGNTLTGEMSRTGTLRLRWPYVEKTARAAAADAGLSAEATDAYITHMKHRFKSVFPETNEDTLAGGLSNTISGHLTKQWGMRGGAFTVDGACASSLIAVSQACDYLRNGTMKCALVGGVDISLDTFELIGFSRAGAISREDMHVYGSDAKGFLPGEGAGFVMLKRLQDAVRDGDKVYCSVEGWGVSSDGQGGIMEPISSGQQLALDRAYTHAPYSMADIHFVEGHGTGTARGDEAELTAISTVRRKHEAERTDVAPNRPAMCGVTSLKSIIGHTKAASGVGAFIKAVIGVNQRTIPPTGGLTYQSVANLFRKLDNIYPVLQAKKIEDCGNVRAGVSGMGFGGINCHITVSSLSCGSPDAELTDPAGTGDDVSQSAAAASQDAELLIIAEADRSALADELLDLAAIVEEVAPADLGDLASERARLFSKTDRASFPCVCALVVTDPFSAADQLRAAATELDSQELESGDFVVLGENTFVGYDVALPDIGYLFPGQGSQVVHMACVVLLRMPSLRGTILDKLSSDPEVHEEAVSFFDEFLTHHYQGTAAKNEAEQRLKDTTRAQPALCLASAVWVEFLRAVGVAPKVVAGHSLGELVALYASEHITLVQLLKLAKRRGAAMGEAMGGSMVSVTSTVHKVEALLSDNALADHKANLFVSNVNAPRRVVVSGEEAAIVALEALCADRRVGCARLRVSAAFHTPYMQAAADQFKSDAAQVLEGGASDDTSSVSRAAVFSSMTAEAISADADLADHLAKQITSPVNFVGLMKALASSRKCQMFLEVGPGRAMTTLSHECLGVSLKKCVGDVDKHICYPVEPRCGSFKGILAVLARLAVTTATLDLAFLWQNRYTRPFLSKQARDFLINPCELPQDPLPKKQARKLAAAVGEGNLATMTKHLPEGRRGAVLSAYLEHRASALAQMIASDMLTLPPSVLESAKTLAEAAEKEGDDAGADNQASKIVSIVDRDSVITAVVSVATEITGLDARPETTLPSISLDSIKRARLITDTARAIGMAPGEVNPTAEMWRSMTRLDEIGTQIHILYSRQGQKSSRKDTVAAPAAEYSAVSSNRSWVRAFSEDWIPAEAPILEAGPFPEPPKTTLDQVSAVAVLSLLPDSLGDSIDALSSTIVSPIETMLNDLGVTVTNVSLSPTAEDPLVSSPAPSHVFVIVPSAVDPAKGINDPDTAAATCHDGLWFLTSVARYIDALSDHHDGRVQVQFIAEQDQVAWPVDALAATMHLESGGDSHVTVSHVAPKTATDLVTSFARHSLFVKKNKFLRLRLDADGNVTSLNMSLDEPVSFMPSEADDGAEIEDRPLVPFDDSDAVVVSGGGRGITAKCALKFGVESACKKFVLLGRAKADHEEVAATVKDFADAGIDALYIPTDVTSLKDCEAVASAVQEKGWSVVGVIHGAARNDANPAASVKLDAACSELSVKIQGLCNLLAVFQDNAEKKLGFISCLSSIIGVTGMFSSGVYGFSNQLMERIAIAHAGSETAVACIRYAHWESVGMAARMGSVDFLGRMGMTAIDVPRGVESFSTLTQLARRSLEPVIRVVSSRVGGLATWCETDSSRIIPSELGVLELVHTERVGVESFVRAVVSHDSHPYLKDHVISGSLIMPAVVLLESAAQSSTFYGGYTIDQVQSVPSLIFNDVAFQYAVSVPWAGEETLQVHVIDMNKDSTTDHSDGTQAGPRPLHLGWEVRASAVDYSQAATTGVFTLPGEISSEPTIASPPSADVDSLPTPLKAAVTGATKARPIDPAQDIYRAKLLFHGPVFQRIKSVFSAAWDAETRTGHATVLIHRDDASAPGQVCMGQQRLINGDPFFRDALLQASKLIIPQHGALPAKADKIEIFRVPEDFVGDVYVHIDLVQAEEGPAGPDSDLKSWLSDITAVCEIDGKHVVVEKWTKLRLNDLDIDRSKPLVVDLMDPTSRDQAALDVVLEEAVDSLAIRCPTIAVQSGQKYHDMKKDERHQVSQKVLGSAAKISWNADGKPVVSGSKTSSVSITHTDLVLAVGHAAEDDECGIDLTEIFPDEGGQAAHVLEGVRDAEITALRQDNADCEHLAASRVWTALEAVFKATGAKIESMVVKPHRRFGEGSVIKITGPDLSDPIFVLTVPFRPTLGPRLMLALTGTDLIPNPVLEPSAENMWATGMVYRVVLGPAKDDNPYILKFRMSIPFRECTSLTRHVSAPVFFSLIGRTREDGVTIFGEMVNLTAAFLRDQLGAVTDWVRFSFFSATTMNHILEINLWQTGVDETSGSLRMDVYSVPESDPTGAKEWVASGEVQISSVRMVGHDAALTKWPRTMYKLMLMMTGGVAKKEHKLPPPPTVLLGSILFEWKPAEGASWEQSLPPAAFTRIVTASQEESNYVGNVYFAMYPQWLSETLTFFIESVDPDITRTGQDKEIYPLSIGFDYEIESYPYDSIAVKVHIVGVYENGFDMRFVFHRYYSDTGKTAEQLCVGKCFALYTGFGNKAQELIVPASPRSGITRDKPSQLSTRFLPTALPPSLAEGDWVQYLEPCTHVAEDMKTRIVAIAGSAPVSDAESEESEIEIKPPPPPPKEGWVSKQGYKGLKSWRKRWFNLQPTHLIYSKGPDGQGLRGAIKLDDITGVEDRRERDLAKNRKVDPNNRKAFEAFFIYTRYRDYRLMTTSPSETREWVALLRRHVDYISRWGLPEDPFKDKNLDN